MHLHIHLEGSARPGTVAELAAEAGVPVPDLWAYHALPGLIQRYRALTSLIRTPDHLARLIREFVEDEALQGVMYCEPMFSPRLYAERFGWTLLDAFLHMDAVFQDAARRWEIEVRYMIGGNWSRPTEAKELARFAAQQADEGIVAFGLAGEEPSEGIVSLKRACDLAHDAGLLVVPHVGETGGPDAIGQALDLLRPDRVAHGVGAARDPKLLRRLAAAQVVCDVCPTANVHLGLARNVRDHPIGRMLDAGVPITVNADDPLFFRTTLLDDLTAVRETLGLMDADLASMTLAGTRASGASAAARDRIHSAVATWLGTPPQI